MNIRNLLIETHAHMPPAGILSNLSAEDAIRRFDGLPHSIADIVAHIEFWQSWFLKRCRGEAEPMVASAALGWPAVDGVNWNGLHDRFLAGLEEAAALGDRPDRIAQPINPAIELPMLADYRVGDALTHLANHNSHHLGQIVTLRQLLGLWPPPSGSWTW